ncbi:52 kDa repressor of the inhibitor of the protein kinase-like, partial [Aphis craccivora]
MSGKVQGVKSYIQTKYPKTIYVHCAAHSLNLAVSTASDLKPIRNCLGIIEKRYDAVNDFCELLPYVMISLDKISEWRDSSSADASILKKAIDSEFLISLFVIKKLFSFGLPLCRQLQLKRIDLKDA